MIYVLSGGISHKYGFWHVNFPVGSSCTLTNGTRTYKAPSDAVSLGKYTFPIPESGSWTVSCTDGIQTASKAITFSSKYSYAASTLSYNFVLFAAGSGLAAGYTAESKTTDAYSFTDSALVFNTKSGQGLKGLITPAIDLTDFSKMLVTYKDVAYYDVSDTGKGFVGVTDKEYSVWSQNNYNTPGFPAYIRPSAGEGTQELDISGLSGNYYFVLSGDWFAITVTSIIFE